MLWSSIKRFKWFQIDGVQQFNGAVILKGEKKGYSGKFKKSIC